MRQPFWERVKSFICTIIGHKKPYEHWHFNGITNYICERCNVVISEEKE